MSSLERTLIKGPQIRTSDFIKSTGSSGLDWQDDKTTASQLAIDQKIREQIADVAGAMLYRGSWTEQAVIDSTAGPSNTSAIKKGYVYVYAGRENGSIGAVVLEPGDMLIANRDRADLRNSEHWTIVNMNITGALTEAGFIDWLVANSISPGSGENNIVDVSKDIATGKLKLGFMFPTITNTGSGDFVRSITINQSTGVITAVKGTPTDMASRLVLDEECDVDEHEENIFHTRTEINTEYPFALFVNGVKQTLYRDYELDTTHYDQPCFVFTRNAYIPTDEDVVTCMYFKKI